MHPSWRELFAMRPPLMSWQDNLRLIAPVYLALIGFSMAGQFIHGLIVALGGYIVLFGGGQAARLRLKVYLAVSALMLLAVTLGVLSAASFPLTVLTYLAVALAAVIVNILLGLGPPGPYFFVLMVSGGATLAQGGMRLGTILLYVALGNALAILFAMADVVYDRYRAERRAIAAAADAVQALARAVEPAAGAGTKIDAPLAAAAAAVHRAWSAFMAGAGQDDNAAARRVEHELHKVQRRYRALYVDIAERHLLAADGDPYVYQGSSGLGQTTDAGDGDTRRSAVGEPSLRYRLAAELSWPSMTWITLMRVGTALVIATGITHWARDQHPFWASLVIALVLSYPGSQTSLTLRGVQRFLGTSAGIGIFVALSRLHLNEAAYIVVLCALLWPISRLTGRNYLYGSVFITLLALYMTVPLSPAQAPLALAANRWMDTLIAVLIALAMIWLIGPRSAPALAKASIRRISLASQAVLERILSQQDFTDPDFVEDRRRLEYALLGSGQALQIAAPSAAGTAAYANLEQVCTRLGYLVLGSSWLPLSKVECQRLRQLSQYDGAIAACLDDPAAERCSELATEIARSFEHDG